MLVYGGQKTLKRIDFQDFLRKKGNKLKNEYKSRDGKIQSRRLLYPHAQTGNNQTIKQTVHDPGSSLYYIYETMRVVVVVVVAAAAQERNRCTRRRRFCSLLPRRVVCLTGKRPMVLSSLRVRFTWSS